MKVLVLGATGGTGRDRPRRPGERLSWINGRHRHPIGSPQPKGTPTPTELLAQVHFAYHSATGALTARSDEVDRIVGLELGAVDYEPKPFSPREIASRVRAIPRRTREPEPAEPTMEPLFRVDFGVLKRMYVGPHDRGQNLKLTA